jgi:ABC-type antimicrobial peptide transport system permease subunit
LAVQSEVVPGSSGSGVISRVYWAASRNITREGKQALLPVLTIAAGVTLIFVTQVFAEYLRQQASLVAGLFGPSASSETIFESSRWIAIIVLGIGAMETIIVMSRNVFRRTREIGIMKAVGIRPRTISLIIVIETFLYGVLGGVTGVVGGVLVVLLLALSQFSLEPVLIFLPAAPSASAYAFGLAVASAVVAGLYPSYRALRLSVLEAISHTV